MRFIQVPLLPPRFLNLPCEVYRGDADYCPTAITSVREGLFRDAFLERQRILIAIDERDRCVGRLVARISPTLQGEGGGPLGMVGFFEALDEPEPVGRLFADAIAWLRDRGCRQIVGPMDGDTWHRYRLNTGPFDRPPFLMEPYNRPYYPSLWKAAGFTPLESYYSKHVKDMQPVIAQFERILERVRNNNYQLRRIAMSRFHDELRRLYRLSTAIFAGNYLYEDITEKDFFELYEPARSIIDPDLVWFATAPDGGDAGFVFAMHDYHRSMVAMGGRRGLIAKMKFVLNRRHADAVNIKSLGVLESHRRSGLGAALICQAYIEGAAKGYSKANLCLIRDGNPSGRLDGGQGFVSRNYVLYQCQ